MVRRLFFNIGSNVSALIVRILLTFIMTPIYLRELGDYDYGVWEILAVLIGYMGILDIGIKPTVTRYISKYKAIDNFESVQQVYSTANLFMLCMGVLGALLLITSGHVWLSYQVTEQEYSRYILLLLIVSLVLIFQFPSLVIDGALEGLQMHTLKNAIAIIKNVLVSIVIYYLIDVYDGLMVLSMVTAIGMLLKYLVGLILLRHPSVGELKFTIKDFSLNIFLESLRFGFKSFIQGLASRIQLGSDRIIIGYFLGPVAVPFYSIPSSLIGYIRNLGWTICDVFMPLFSSLDAKSENDKIRQVYMASSRIIVGILFPACIGAVILGGPFIGLWLGDRYQEKTEIILIILIIMTLLPFLNPMSARYLTALNEHGLLAKVYSYGAVVNLILSMILVHWYGIVGVAIGTALPVFVMTPVVLRRCCQLHEMTMLLYTRKCIFPSVIPVLLMFGAVYAYKGYSGLNSYLELSAAVIIGVLVYSPMFYFMVLEAEERQWVVGNVLKLLRLQRA